MVNEEFDLMKKDGIQAGIGVIYGDIAAFLVAAWRDILVRYSNCDRPAWSLSSFLDAIFTIVFGRLPIYSRMGCLPILVYVAMLPWQFFPLHSMMPDSLITNSKMHAKIIFLE
jgi:hypothetical protein